MNLVGGLDGYKVEGVFRKTRLNCKEIDDPYLQAALILHNTNSVNEVFLLSLRDCVLELPDDHYLKKWFLNSGLKKSQREKKNPIQMKIDEGISSILLKDEITKDERAQLSHFLSLLDTEPPYLDYVLYRILSYAKIGNWSRSEKIILDFIEMDPIERMKQTPARGETSLLATKVLSLQVMNEITRSLKQKIILDSLFQLIQDFYSDPELIKEAKSLQDFSSGELAEKVQLKYNFVQMPQFSTWLSTQYLSNTKKESFLIQNLSQKELTVPWILLGSLPDSPAMRELVAKQMPKLIVSSPQIFYHLIANQEMIGVVTRVAPYLLKNIKNTKRQFYLKEWESNYLDYWAMANLIEMGQVNESFLKKLTEL